MKQYWKKSLYFLLAISLVIALSIFGTSCKKYSRSLYAYYYQLKEASKLHREIKAYSEKINLLTKAAQKKIDKIEKLQLFSSSDYLTAADYVEEALKPIKATEPEAFKITDAVNKFKKLRLPGAYQEYLRLLSRYSRAKETSLSALIQLYEGYRDQYNLRYLIANITEVSNNAIKVFDEGRYTEAKELFTQTNEIMIQTKNALKQLRNAERLSQLSQYLDKDQEITLMSIERSKALLSKNYSQDQKLFETYKKLWEERESIQWKNEWKQYIAAHENEFYSTYFRESDIAANYWEKAQNYYDKHLKDWE